MPVGFGARATACPSSWRCSSCLHLLGVSSVTGPPHGSTCRRRLARSNQLRPGAPSSCQTNQRPSRISSRSVNSFTSRQAWMRRGEMRNQRYGVASVRGSKPLGGEPVTPLLRQRVDLEDLDVAVDHGHVASVAQRQPDGSGGRQVPAGRALGRRGHQQRLAVPVEGQRHQERRSVGQALATHRSMSWVSRCSVSRRRSALGAGGGGHRSWSSPRTLPSGSVTLATRRPPPTSCTASFTSAPAAVTSASFASMSVTCQ